MGAQALSPVLSEQIAVAPPIVSQAASTRTKLLSFIICFMLHNGRPVSMHGESFYILRAGDCVSSRLTQCVLRE